jgi:hypothetical protein
MAKQLRCPPDLAIQDGPDFSYDFNGTSASGSIDYALGVFHASVGKRKLTYHRHQNIVFYDGDRIEADCEGCPIESIWWLWMWLKGPALNRDADKLAKAEGIEWSDAYDRVVKADEDGNEN